MTTISLYSPSVTKMETHRFNIALRDGEGDRLSHQAELSITYVDGRFRKYELNESASEVSDRIKLLIAAEVAKQVELFERPPVGQKTI